MLDIHQFKVGSGAQGNDHQVGAVVQLLRACAVELSSDAQCLRPPGWTKGGALSLTTTFALCVVDAMTHRHPTVATAAILPMVCRAPGQLRSSKHAHRLGESAML